MFFAMAGTRANLVHVVRLMLVAASLQFAHAPVWAQTPPPRSIDDILKILEQYKPDPQKVERDRAAAAMHPPDTTDPTELARFYHQRGRANGRIGLINRQIADLRLAAEHMKDSPTKTIVTPDGIGNEIRMLFELSNAEARGGNVLSAKRVRETLLQRSDHPATSLATTAALLQFELALGDIAAAKRRFTEMESYLSAARSTPAWAAYHYDQTAHMERARTALLAAEGKWVEAERAARATLENTENDLPRNPGRKQSRPQQEYEGIRDADELRVAQVLAYRGQLAEAETLTRNALRSSLTREGPYTSSSGTALTALARIVMEQGRVREASALAAAAVDSYEKAGVPPEGLWLVDARKTYARTLASQARWADADAAFARAAEGLSKDPELAARRGVGEVAWGYVLVKTGQPARAVEMIEPLLQRSVQWRGDNDVQTAEIRGYLAIALAAAGQRGRALAEFRNSVPILLEQARVDVQSESAASGRATRLRTVLEGYLDALLNEKTPDADAVNEAFRIADVARGSGVQRALTASAARLSISDPNLAELARREQDALTRLGLLAGVLSRLDAAPADQRLPRVIDGIRREIDALRAERAKLREEIEKRFPDYANLVEPKPATTEQVRARLKDGEAMISIYVGAERTYAWAVPKQGATAFNAIAIGDSEVTKIVARLRRALDPNVTKLEDIPRFDLALAHQLYAQLLQAVEAGWKDAKSLVIVPHGALGQLPFAVLPTKVATLPAKDEVHFDGYRQVPWLAREKSVTQLPSANTLIVLRNAPGGAANRRAFAGFGDPYFSKSQSQAAPVQLAANEVSTRAGVLKLRSAPQLEGVSSASLALLPRLPDTRDEILEVGKVMNADLKEDVFLGERASVGAVKGAKLDNRKVIHFATHGLVPGELDGLTQPALALTSPEIAGADSGDGLLKTEDVLALKLNADWVVLSACNTASGDGSSGAEAVSGLGRAFFYAGARALLVSNWPVDSASSRKLMTDLFRRQAADGALNRAEALRQAMLGLVDGDGEVDAKTGKPLYRYAHPLFWAPFSLVGDGSGV